MKETVVFYPSGHRYVHRLTGKPYTAVSTVLNHYEGPFRTRFWTIYKALEEVKCVNTARYARYSYPVAGTEEERLVAYVENRLTEEEKLLVYKIAEKKRQEWKRNSYKARRAGSKRHDKLERAITSADTIIKDGLPYKPMEFLCDKADFQSRGIAAEVTVFNDEFELSGRVDRVDKNRKEIEIIDYKTNKEIKMSNEWEKFRYPLDSLDKCTWNRYLLQMNTYGWMFSMFGFIVKKLTLVHDRTKEGYDVPIRPDLVLTMLNHWKNEGKTEAENSKSKKDDTG
jgi:hypothetical protein